MNATTGIRPGGRGWPARGAYAAIRLVLFDVDGVLTDGGLFLDARGAETKRFDVRDGSGMAFLRHAGLEMALLSGRSSRATERRAADLHIPKTRVWQGAKHKAPVFAEVLKTCGVRKEEVAFIGDDIVDLPVLEQAGISACPGDAHPAAMEASHLICTAPGGRGAVRQFCEHLIKRRGTGEWERTIRSYLGQKE